ncbi:hypothetical protein [Aureibacillus halotolerans]|uniref:Glycosyl transferase family 1 n=1 Tax=Aureibacillus halotolerans TaxID=1508390 RepID=A0A4R6U8V1_9BACI|nr:hypothetical protein [Aureibacillus halotolerans]TDQ43020.1 hypothetical protein EV213_101452 [Aureibacillus halotolerans]
MSHVVFYISDTDSRHAMRDVVLIEALFSKHSELHITIVHTAERRYLSRRLYPYRDRLTFRTLECQFGYRYQLDGWTLSESKMTEDFETLCFEWPELLANETAFLRDSEARLVVSDIEPVAFPAAHAAGIPSIGLSNFTWSTVYEDLFGKNSTLLEDAYGHMDCWIRLEGHHEPAWGRDQTVNAGWFGATENTKRIRRLRRRWMAHEEKKQIAYIDLGTKEDEFKLPAEWTNRQDTMFVVSSGMMTGSANVVPVPKFEKNPQDYIAASDWVFTRPNWTTVSTAVLAGIPLRLVGQTAMYDVRHLCATVELSYLGETHLVRDWSEMNEVPFTVPERKKEMIPNQLPLIIETIEQRL